MQHHKILKTKEMKVLMSLSQKGRKNVREISVSDIHNLIRNNSSMALSNDECFLKNVNDYKNRGTKLILYSTTDSKQYWKDYEKKIQDTSYHAHIGCVDVDCVKDKVQEIFVSENGREGTKEEVKLLFANLLNKYDMFTTNISAWFDYLDNSFLVQRSSGGGFKIWFCCDEINNQEDYNIFGKWITKQTQDCFKNIFPELYDLIEWDETAKDITHGQYNRAYNKIVEYRGDYIDNNFDLDFYKELYKDDVQEIKQKVLHTCVNIEEIYIPGGYGTANCASLHWNIPITLKEFGNVSSPTYFRNAIGTGFKMNNISIEKAKEIVAWYFDNESIDKFNEENNLSTGYNYQKRCSQVIVNYVGEIISEYNQVHKKEEHNVLTTKYLQSFWSIEESNIIHSNNESNYLQCENILSREDTTFWKDVNDRLIHKEKLSIESPMGSGKSFGILNFIYRYFWDKKIIYIYPLSTQYSKTEDWVKEDIPRLTKNTLSEWNNVLPDKFFCNFSSVDDLMTLGVLTKEKLEEYTIIVDEVQMALSEGKYRDGIFKVVDMIKQCNTGVLYLTGTNNDILADLNIDYKWTFTYDKSLLRQCSYDIVSCKKKNDFHSFVIDTINKNNEDKVKTIIFCNSGNKSLRQKLENSNIKFLVIKKEEKDDNNNKVVSYVKSDEVREIEKGKATDYNVILFTSYFSVGSDLNFKDSKQEYDFICILDDVDGTNIVQAIGRQRNKTLRNIHFVECKALINQVHHGELHYKDLEQLENRKEDLSQFSDVIKKNECLKYLRKNDFERHIWRKAQEYYESHKSISFILKLLKFNGYDVTCTNSMIQYTSPSSNTKRGSITKELCKFSNEILRIENLKSLVNGFKSYRRERDDIIRTFLNESEEDEESGFSNEFKEFFDNNNQEKILELSSKIIIFRNTLKSYVGELCGSDTEIDLDSLGEIISKNTSILGKRRIFSECMYDIKGLNGDLKSITTMSNKDIKFFVENNKYDLAQRALNDFLQGRKVIVACVDNKDLKTQCEKEIVVINTVLKKFNTSLGGKNSSRSQGIKLIAMSNNKEYVFDSKGELMKSLKVSSRTFSKIIKEAKDGDGTFENKERYNNVFELGIYKLEYMHKCA